MTRSILMEQFGKGLSGINIYDFYTRYQGWIDFGIYLYLFTSLTWIIYPKLFGERHPSKTLSQAVAVFLSIGAMVAEKIGNFSIATFWPVAVAIFLLVVSLFAYHLLVVLKVESFTAISTIFLVMYLSMISWQPSLWDWLQRFPMVSSSITIGAILAGIVLFTKIIPPFLKNFTKITREGGLDASFITKLGANQYREDISDLKYHHRNQFHQEHFVIANRMKKISLEAEKDSEQIKSCFLTIHALCTNYKKQLFENEFLRKELFEAIQKILPSEQHALWSKITLLADNLRKIYNFDLREMRNLSGKYKDLHDKLLHTKATEEDLANMRRVIHEEHKNHRFENRFAHLEKELKSHVEKLEAITQELANSIGNADIDKAAALSEAGIEESEEGIRLVEKQEHLERRMDHLCRKIVHQLDQLKEVKIK